MGAARFGRNNLLKATLLVATGVLAACLVAIVGAAGPVGAAFPGENGKIAFSSYRDEASSYEDIYTMNADGSGLVNLTNHPRPDVDPAFSPDGTKIAFTSYRDGNSEIYVMNADGSGLVRLTNHPDHDFDPAFSPDGTKIAFRSDRDGDPEIYAMNAADGSGLVNLTNNPADDFDPAFSPDGTKIAFRSDRDGNWEIYTMNADGSGLVRLTNDPTEDAEPSFSPDGTRIAFRRYHDFNQEIYTMNADGSEPVNLTNHPRPDIEPSFSPDGTKIAFLSDRDGDPEIYAMNAADGSGLTNLTNNPGYIDTNPDWGPLATERDVTAPSAPTVDLDASSDTGKLDTDDATKDDTPTFLGEAEAGSTVEIFAGSASIGTTTASPAGEWSLTAPDALSEGTHAITATATDANLNASAPSAELGVLIDKSAPTLSFVGAINDGDGFHFGDTPAAPTCSADDGPGGSGVDGACAVSGYGTAVGTHTLATNAVKDVAGNEARALSLTYRVLPWTIDGFYSPVDMPGELNTVNVAKAGSTVPLKFEVFKGTTELTNTGAVKAFAQKITCPTPGSTDDIEKYASGKTALRYDATAGQFVFNWQTPKSPGSCYEVTMSAKDDHSKITAYFRLR